MNIRVTPGMTVLLRDGQTNLGFGGRARWSLGLEDFVGLEATLGCDHLSTMQHSNVVSSAGVDGTVVYDATRCLAVPGVVFRFGSRLVFSAALGLGYRLELQSSRELGAEGVLLERLEDETSHQLVAVSRAALEYRLTPFWSFGAFVEPTIVVAGSSPELDLHAGVVVGGYFYP